MSKLFSQFFQYNNPLMNDSKPQIRLDCKACDHQKSMIPSSLHKFSSVVVVIGKILIIPSILGIVGGLSCFVNSFEVDPGLGFVMMLVISVPSLVFGLLGYLLVMRKKVYQCQYCSSIIDRA